jgi:putative DNA primase/helicase
VNAEYAKAADKLVLNSIAAIQASQKPIDIIAGWRSKLILTAYGKPRANVANAITAVRFAPEFHCVLAFDEFATRTITLKSIPWNPEPHPWGDTEDILLAEWLQHQGINVSRELAGQAVEAVSRERAVHPVKDYLNRLRWDGIGRLDSWPQTYLGVKPSLEIAAYVSAVGACWFISGVARIYEPGCKADHCLILEGGQGSLKSTAVRSIAGPWYVDEVSDLGSKDAAMQIRGAWIVELAELDAMNRSETSKVKGFMSRATDHFRPPYGKRVVDLPRQCIFAGTVNDSSYLRDETGGRRFWPITCGVIRIDALQHDRDQLWAEAVARYRHGDRWWLETAELNSLATAEQSARFEGDAWDSLILEWAESRLDTGIDSISVSEVLFTCLEKKKEHWTRADEMRVSRCLKARGWERYRDRKRDNAWRYRPRVPNV